MRLTKTLASGFENQVFVHVGSTGFVTNLCYLLASEQGPNGSVFDTFVLPILGRQPRWRGRHGQARGSPGDACQAGAAAAPERDANARERWGL